MEYLGKYKDTIKEAINKYKNQFGSFENQVSYSNFYNDVKNSNFLKLEDCLQVVYIKITGKPFSEYKNEEKNNNKNNNDGKKTDDDDSSKEITIVKNFIDEIFKWALHNK